MKKLFIFLIVVVSIVILSIWGIVWYIKPEQALDLRYEEVSIADKVLDIVKSRRPEVQLTEQDVNNLIKKSLAAHAELATDVVVSGAKFELKGSVLEADVNLLWDYKVHAGAKLIYTLEWKDPLIIAVPVQMQINSLNIPVNWLQLQPFPISLQEHLPKLVSIKGVTFDEKSIRIGLKLK